MNEHYYASSVYGWATATTKEKALAAVARHAGSGLMARLRKGDNRGLYVQVVKVGLPEAAHYTISGYLPHTITKEDGVNETRKGERVPMGPVEEVIVTTMTGKHHPAA